MINHDAFIECIHEKRCARVAFTSKKDNGALRERICAPLDYGSDRRATDKKEKYHFYDLDGDHPLKKFDEEIVSFEPLQQLFDPATFVTCNVHLNPWWVRRDWGLFS